MTDPTTAVQLAELRARIGELELTGPLKFTMAVYLTNGFRTATSTVTLPLGQLPTAEVVEAARRTALERATEKLGGTGWRELDRTEFLTHVLREQRRL